MALLYLEHTPRGYEKIIHMHNVIKRSKAFLKRGVLMFIKIIDLQLLATEAEIPKRYVLLKLNFMMINQ